MLECTPHMNLVNCYLKGMSVKEAKQFIEVNTGRSITKAELREVKKEVLINTGTSWK